MCVRKWKESRWEMRNTCQRQKRTGVRKNKTFFFLEEKEEEGFCKAPSSKNVLDEGEKFFILNFFVCW